MTLTGLRREFLTISRRSCFVKGIWYKNPLFPSTKRQPDGLVTRFYREQISVGFSLTQKPRRLTTVPTKEQIWKIICAPKNLRNRLLLMTTHAAGLRASEAIRLKPAYIDSERMLIKVVGGKGRKDIYPLWSECRKIVFDLLNCRTAHLGGHIDCCSNCGMMRIAYHSCRSRHGPKCQHMPRERCLEKRKDEILPASYFHVVFTPPHELNPIIFNNKNVMLNILFKSASQTLLTFGENALGGKWGFIATFHSWDQRLKAHFHLH